MRSILGYDCDENEIVEFSILRSPFSAHIDNWEDEPNIDPRFYCAIKSNNGEYWAISVYDDYNSKYIRKFEHLSNDEEIPTIIKPISEMENYEVARSGIDGNWWYYDRDKRDLRHKLETILKNENGYCQKLKKEIPFDYFYRMFQSQCREKILEIEQKRIAEHTQELSEIFDFYYTTSITQEDCLPIYNQVLFDICTDYITLSDSDINILPTDPLELVDLILDTMHDNPYQESFLQSLQFIYKDYLNCLGKGSPILMSTKDISSSPFLKVTLDSRYQITQFDAINMDLLEEDKTMTKIVSMEKNHQIGPIPKVLIHFRKDI